MRLAIRFASFVTLLAFTLASNHAQAQTYSVLVNLFGQLPSVLAAGSTVAQGRDGNFYGTSLEGGTNGLGTIFKLTASGTLTTLYSFDGTVGQYPYGGLTLGTDGNFYGTTNRGSTFGNGSVYKVTPTGAVTLLHAFTNTGDGTNPSAAPLTGSDGNFYGTASGLDVSTTLANSTFYKITPTGTLTVLHTFDPTTEGSDASTFILGADGSFYGSAATGGVNNWGTLFKITPAGAFTVLHAFNNIDGRQGASLAQASNGTFYGTATFGGVNSAGVIFKLTSTGVFTKLYDLNDTQGDGNGVISTTLGTDGNFYNIAYLGGANAGGTIFKFNSAGIYTKLFDFGGVNAGISPLTGLSEATSGLFYGSTELGSTGNAGVLYTFNVGFTPFVSLVTTSGKVGTKVGILGQGFSAASVVKFNGVQATAVTRTGTTFLLATVPTGASSGKVIVTTGATTLTSAQTFTVHDSWSSGASIPTAVQAPGTGVISGKVYVVGGATNTTIIATNQVYNLATNTWTTAASMPTARFAAASAEVNNILYVIGGNPTGSTQLNVVEAYNPTTNSWTTKAPMPTARDSATAVVQGGMIYVIGGFNNAGQRLTTVESYNPTTDTWSTKASLLVGKSMPAAGLLGSTIVAAGGLASSGVTGDNEGYNVSTNTWSALTADPTARQSTCNASITGMLYLAGGSNGTPLSLNESYNNTAHKWTTLTSMPVAVVSPGSATANNLLYCFGGSNNGAFGQGTVFNNVQIYQP